MKTPSWMLSVVLLAGTGLLLLLAANGLLPPLSASWPLLMVLIGALVIAAEPRAYLVFGGTVAAMGVLFFLHTAGRVPLSRAWPVILLVLAALIVADRMMATASGRNRR